MEVAVILAFIGAIVGGGAAGAVINSIIAHRKAEQDKKDARRFLAHTLAFEFERYAVSCAEKLSDGEPEGPDDERTPGSMGSLPEALTLPQSPAYQWLDSDTLERIFAFPQNIAVARAGLAYVWQVADGGAYDDEARKKLAEFGLAAAGIAADLREQNGIKPRVLEVGQWNIIKHLQAVAEKEARRYA